MKSLKMLFVGGGSLGHVLPLVAVHEAFLRKAPDLRSVFVCSRSPADCTALRRRSLTFFSIAAPKFPRREVFRALLFVPLFMLAFLQSLWILCRERPRVIFSKGGFVSVPMCLVGWAFGIPIVIHTSDAVPSMSDRSTWRFARTIFTGFPLAGALPLGQKNLRWVGNPVRDVMMRGSKSKALQTLGFSGNRPVVLIVGGSLGAVTLNRIVDCHREELSLIADIIHLTGPGKGSEQRLSTYAALPSAGDELADYLAAADLIVSRAGAGAIAEIAAAKKAAIMIPLEGVAHDHQRKNAEFLEAKNAAVMLRECDQNELPGLIRRLLASPADREVLAANLQNLFPPNAAERIADSLLDVLSARA